RLQAAEFLYEARLFPDLEYTFKHALTHEVASQSLLQERRRALHARIVEVFETLYPDRVTERVNWLAHHAFRGEVWDKALTYLRHTERTFPPGMDTDPGGGPESLGHLWWTGDYDRAVTVGQRDLIVATDFGHFALKVVTNFRLGQVYHALGDYPRAIDFFKRNMKALDGELVHERFDMAGLPSVLSRAWLASCLAECGEFAEGIACGEEGVRIAEEVDDTYSLIVACVGMGNLYLLKGDLVKAISALERGLVLDQVANIPVLFPFIASPLGSAYARCGRVAEALSLLERSVEQAVSMKLMAHHSLRFARLSEANLLAGQVDRAIQFAGQALNLSREHKEHGHRAYALLLLGDIESLGDAPQSEKAEASYRAALALAEDLDMRPLVSLCRWSLGQLYRRAGSGQKADEYLTTATLLLREMDMQCWMERVQASSEG
ncbi:MAG TPA: hypothetical protein VJO34_10440, partial [Methylomirabilota bacterium]|nr:hypothetical protein [Methylomirabilota bacterium]